MPDDPISASLLAAAYETEDELVGKWLMAVLTSEENCRPCGDCEELLATEWQRKQKIAEQQREQELVEQRRRETFAEQQRNQLPEVERLAKERKEAARQQRRDIEKIARILAEGGSADGP